MAPLMIGVAGPSSSGKTTLCKKFTRRHPGTTYLCLDSFYKNRGCVPRVRDGNIEYDNWDLPDSLHLDLFFDSLEALRQGKSISVPKYSVKSERRVGYRQITPGDYVVVDGFLLYVTPELQRQFDLRIFIDISEENLRQRRLERKIDYIPNYLDRVVLPEFQRVGPMMRDSAHEIIDGNFSRRITLKKFETILKNRNLI